MSPSLSADQAVLVIVDIQGKLATLMHEKELFYDNVGKMIKASQVLNIPILWNEQLPDKLGETIPEIKSLLTDNQPLAKNTFSCCGNQDFLGKLRELKRTQVLLTGMETHVCVYQTARDLLNMGFEVHLIADAVSSRTQRNSQLGIAKMKACGAEVTSVEMALFEMLQVAEGEAFKRIIKIVK